MSPVPSRVRRLFRAACFAAALAATAAPALPQPSAADDALVTDAREAARKRDRSKLAALRTAAVFAKHPLAPWIEYWELGSRLGEVNADEVEAFYSRWSGSYVEDRLRNDWLLELGRRRDWAHFVRDYPRFRMNDDRQVGCYALLTDHLAGRDVREAAIAAWYAQRDPDDGCHLLAQTLFDAKQLKPVDVWRKLRLAVAAGRLRTANLAATLFEPAVAKKVADALDSPGRFVARYNEATAGPHAQEILALAIVRSAAADASLAADRLQQRGESDLDNEQLAWAWAATAQQSALALDTAAAASYTKAWAYVKRGHAPEWGDEILGWNVRAQLRAGKGAERWAQVRRAIEAMSASEQREPAWTYWKARALLAAAPAPAPAAAHAEPASGAAADAPAVDPRRAEALALLESIASPWSFYGALALEDLGRSIALPARPAPPGADEQEAARNHPGLSRALLLIGLGLRNEGVREWNFSLRGMDDRALLAAAQLACDRQIWDRCINSSDRTTQEIDVAQRFPMPFRDDVVAKARAIGLDPAYVYGLIRQESRFIIDARSSAGASGLMQLMPATAKWTAKRIGMDYRPQQVTDRDVNLTLGTSYLKLVLDDLGGSQALAAAAYNAGPNRPRRWRDGPTLEPAIWAENIPFNETRDYVKKVLSNATLYAALLGSKAPSLKARLGPDIGPRDGAAPPPDRELP